jgi:protoporphyrin/coproporphyrin ferrochelatase
MHSHSDNYDAFLLVSFGGPEGMSDVIPFLENVLRGKNVPPERMMRVREHYEAFGGVSPINQQNRNLIAAIKPFIEESGPRLPIYWGNRNWHPLLENTVRQMAQDGVKRALAFVTSAFSSYSSCRQYLEDIEKARILVGDGAPQIDKIRPFHNHPRFIETNAYYLTEALKEFPIEIRDRVEVAFTAHSIPLAMAKECEYERQLVETSRLIAEKSGHPSNWHLVFQSRSGPASQFWLEPDIGGFVQELYREKSVQELVIAPVGFISDHMEVIYDLDHEAQKLCNELGIKLIRANTPGVHPEFVQMIVELVEERVSGSSPQSAIGRFGPNPDVCPVGCCQR